MKSLLIVMLLVMVSVVSAETYVVIENPRNSDKSRVDIRPFQTWHAMLSFPRRGQWSAPALAGTFEYS